MIQHVGAEQNGGTDITPVKTSKLRDGLPRRENKF